MLKNLVYFKFENYWEAILWASLNGEGYWNQSDSAQTVRNL